MEFLENYVVLVVLGVCLCIGYVLKNLVPSEKINRFIPLIMAILGCFINIWVAGWQISPEILLGGLVSGLSSTGLYEVFRNFIKKND